MTDQLTEIVAAKLTHNQKRGLAAGRASNLEFHNDRRTLDAPRTREPSELRAAQLGLAELALTADDPHAWLTDVLRALDLDRIITERTRSRADARQACFPSKTGTMQGYDAHLKAYTRPCNMCDAVAKADREASLRCLGIDPKRSEQWIIKHS